MSSSISGKLISWVIQLSPMAKAMEISKSTLNVIFKTAEKGLLKTKTFPKDGEVCLLELTDKWKKVFDIEH